MPSILQAPIEVKKNVIEADVVTITSIRINTFPGRAPEISFDIQYGISSPEGDVSWRGHDTITVTDSVQLNSLISVSTTGDTLYNEIKLNAYNYLKTVGIIPTDATIS